MDTRNLPNFDNHYGSATLIENWHEDRLYREQVAEGNGVEQSRPFTLSGASPQQHARAVTEWNATVSTYTDAYGHARPNDADGPNDDGRGRAADMCRPQELPCELLLGTGDAAEGTAAVEATSHQWGAFWKGPADKAAGHDARTVAGDTRRSENIHDDLFSSTAAARQQPQVRNLYESNHMQAARRGGPLTFTGAGCSALVKTLDDTVGHVQSVDKETNRPADFQPDEALADRFSTTKTVADTPVAQFFFQRKVPPPTR